MSIDLSYFANYICPRPNHYCNGQHRPNIVNGQDVSGERDIGVCQYWDIEQGCLHEEHPKNKQKIKIREVHVKKEG